MEVTHYICPELADRMKAVLTQDDGSLLEADESLRYTFRIIRIEDTNRPDMTRLD